MIIVPFTVATKVATVNLFIITDEGDACEVHVDVPGCEYRAVYVCGMLPE
jgi:hypothetical protein